MKIGIIGYGIVGKATEFGLKRGHSVFVFDKYAFTPNSIQKVLDCSIIFICVPTPMKVSGEIDLSAIEDTLDTIAISTNDNKILVIKSTAVSGTTEKYAKKYPQFKFVFNPEFLTEKNANEDFVESTRIILGVDDEEVGNVLEDVYKRADFCCPIIKVDFKTAEMIKYACNVFLASQISIANELYEICKHCGIDYEDIKEAAVFDDRIGTNISVPGPDGQRGFGGKCFPKDLNALIYLAKENGYKAYLLEEVWRTNLRFRK